MQTCLASSENLSLCLARVRLIALRCRAALVVHLVELSLKRTQISEGFEPRQLKMQSLFVYIYAFAFCLSFCLSFLYAPHILPQLCP